MIHYGLFFLLAGASAVDTATYVNASAGKQNPSSPSRLLASCSEPFVSVGSYCIHIDLSVSGTWQEMREFCQQMNSDLVILSDPQLYVDIQQYLKAIDTNEYFWIGASDLQQEGQWVWIDGTPVIMGTPYWANYGCDNNQMPTGGTIQNCAVLDRGFHYYLNDWDCEMVSTNQGYPICQL